MPTNISIPGFTPATDDLFVYSQQGGVAQPGATTMAQFQAFVRNNSDVLKCLVQRLWQPQVQYTANHVVWSPNMAPNLQAKVKTAGTTSGVEPVWSEIVGAEVTDGTVVYTMEEIVPTLPTVVSSVTEANGLITVQFTNETQKTFQLVKTVNGVAPNSADGNVTLPVEGVLVGDVMYRAYLADGYVKANGATVSRSDYARLVSDYVEEYEQWYDKDDRYTFTGTIASGSTEITAISSVDILKLRKDMTITGTGIPANTTITAVNEDSVTISAAATRSTTETISYGNINNFPWMYGVGDGSTTMVLPDYRGRFIMGGDMTAVISAGLPNITGAISIFDGAGRMTIGVSAGTGALKGQGSWDCPNFGHSSAYTGLGQINLNASYSSALYGNSSTVQPPSISLIPQIKY